MRNRNRRRLESLKLSLADPSLLLHLGLPFCNSGNCRLVTNENPNSNSNSFLLTVSPRLSALIQSSFTPFHAFDYASTFPPRYGTPLSPPHPCPHFLSPPLLPAEYCVLYKPQIFFRGQFASILIRGFQERDRVTTSQEEGITVAKY